MRTRMGKASFLDVAPKFRELLLRSAEGSSGVEVE
jgi:hypothetical protein